MKAREIHADIYTALTGNAELMTLVDAIYTYVPENTSLNYIVLDGIISRAWDMRTDGTQFFITVRGFIQGRSMEQGYSVLKALERTLHKTHLNGAISFHDGFSQAQQRQYENNAVVEVVSRFKILRR